MNADEILMSVISRPPGERASFLAEACGTDAPLRERVERLLRAHEEAGSFLERSLFDVSRATLPTGSLAPGVRIGPYRLVEPIGEGGMGVVWRAEQDEPVRRSVALKVVRPDLASPRFLSRFAAEREALSRMEHPNVARVLDAGAVGDSPYFVMERVEGAPITRYCDGRRSTVRERLGLFLDLCRGVQHAHEKGVIHRDLKPSNVLVATYDGQPVPKVIDFGLAKAAAEPWARAGTATEVGQVLGTLESMSPEQAGLDARDVDVRSDVYALGVLLYELLTGTTPLERARLARVSLVEALRLVREEDPPRPSARVEAAADAEAAARRRTTLPRWRRALRGDLDWIAMRCLEKDRARRYDSVSALADDVERHLRHRPVAARPPTLRYRTAKYVRRHPTAAVLVAASALLVVGGVTFAFWAQGERAQRAVRLGRLERDVAAAVDEANAEGDRAADLVSDLDRWRSASTSALSAARRAESLVAQAGGELPAATVEGVDRTVARLEADERDRAFLAQVEDLRMRGATVDPKLGRFDSRVSRDEVAEALRSWGVEMAVTAAGDVARAIEARPAPVRGPLVVAFHFLAYRLTAEKEDHLWFRAVVDAIEKDPWRQALVAALRAKDVPRLEALAGEVDGSTQPPAFLTLFAGGEEGNKRWHQILLFKAQHAHPSDFWANANLAWALHSGTPPRLEDSVRYYTAAIALRPRNPGVWLNLGVVFLRTGDPRRAAEAFQRTVSIEPAYVKGHELLGRAYVAQNDLVRAEASFRAALALDPEDADALGELGQVELTKGNRAKALSLLRRAAAGSPKDNRWLVSIGRALQQEGDPAGALESFLAASAIDPKDADVLDDVGNALEELGRWAEAEDAHRKAVALDPTQCGFHVNLGLCLRQRRKWAESLTVLQRAAELGPEVPQARYDFGLALEDAFEWERAVAEYRKALALSPRYGGAAEAVTRVLAREGRMEEAHEVALRFLSNVPADDPTRPGVERGVAYYAAARDAMKVLPDLLAGRTRPRDADERHAYALCAESRGLYRTAATLWKETLGEEGATPSHEDLYRAGICAARAGAGQGEDARDGETEPRAAWRGLAREWLRRTVHHWRDMTQSAVVLDRVGARRMLDRRFLHAPDLTCVREGPEFDALPADERSEWQDFWTEVAEPLRSEE